MNAKNYEPPVTQTTMLEKMAQGLRYIWPDPDYQVPNASAVSYRRYQVGARPVVALFHQVCQPYEV